jgi:uncharacterized protein YndB with AHSA1/START domain
MSVGLDRIQQEVLLQAPLEVVWRAVSQLEQLTDWVQRGRGRRRTACGKVPYCANLK